MDERLTSGVLLVGSLFCLKKKINIHFILKILVLLIGENSTFSCGIPHVLVDCCCSFFSFKWHCSPILSYSLRKKAVSAFLCILLNWIFLSTSDKFEIKCLISSPHVVLSLIFNSPLVLFFFCCVGDDSPPQLYIIFPKVWTIPKSVFTLEMNWTMIQFDPGWDHLFWSKPSPLVQSVVQGTFHTCYFDSDQTGKSKSGPNKVGVKAPQVSSLWSDRYFNL